MPARTKYSHRVQAGTILYHAKRGAPGVFRLEPLRAVVASTSTL
jgi:hypothetical protein